MSKGVFIIYIVLMILAIYYHEPQIAIMIGSFGLMINMLFKRNDK